MNKEYHKTSTIGSLISYFFQYANFFTKPTRIKFIWLCIGIIAMPTIQSVRFLYEWFLKKVTNKSLNSYYYLFSHTKLDLEHIMKTTVKIALSCIPTVLKKFPIFIVTDDTLQAKIGVHFECRKNLFDHTSRNGCNYLKGHCFVGLILKIPVFFKSQNVYYLKVPIGYKLKKEKNKLHIAAEMIQWVMEILKSYETVILCCDSWYPKGIILDTVKDYDNLKLDANVRKDTVLYDLPPEPNGKRGRPPKKGKRLDIHNQEDFNFTKIGKYFVATRKVLTNLFGNNVVYATVTATDLDNKKSYRLFISTIMPEQLENMIPVLENEIKYDITREQLLPLLPYIIYKFRWSIEVVFYEQKTFWSFGDYMLRSAIGIETYANIINICYTCMLLLPWKNKKYSKLKSKSPQQIKYILGQQIQREIFFASFVSDPENTKKYWDYIKTVMTKVLIKMRL